MSSWSSYPKVYALGHRSINGIFSDPVTIEEKIDGSQFSFGLFHDENGDAYLRCRSKGADLNLIAPEKMFIPALEAVERIKHRLHPGWTYRCEFLAKPKHNALAYDRIPADHLIVFDIAMGLEDYMPYEAKEREARRLGLEVVPRIYQGIVSDPAMLRDVLERTSILGGQKIEGVVVKNYERMSTDKKPMIGKFVSEAFKEVHKTSWKADNPKGRDIIGILIDSYRTPARWNKAVQHLRESGKLTDSPQDIPLLFKEVHTDLLAECGDDIKDKLFAWAWKQMGRGVTAGLPEWYKEQLLNQSFNGPEGTGCVTPSLTSASRPSSTS